MYRVYENGIRCNDYKSLGWEKDTFDTKEEAFIFLWHWATPVSYSRAKEFFYQEKNTPNYLNAEVGKDYDISTSEIPVLMKVLCIEENKNEVL